MRKSILSAILFFGCIGYNAKALSAPEGVSEVRVADVFVPSGFDSKSDTYVIESGKFRNGCYHWLTAQVIPMENSVTQVWSYANVSDGMCIQMITPFQKEVSLGKMSAGVHHLRFMNSDGTYLEADMTIEE